MCRCFSLKAPIRVMVIVNILWPLAASMLVAMTILGAAFGDKVVAGVNTSHLEILHWKVTSLFVVGMFIFVTGLWLIINRIWWPCLVPTSITRFASDLGTEWSKIIGLCKESAFFMNNDIKFLTIEGRTRHSPTNLEYHFGLHVSVIFRPQYVWSLVHLYVGLIRVFLQ